VRVIGPNVRQDSALAQAALLVVLSNLGFWLNFCDTATLSDIRAALVLVRSRPKTAGGHGCWADSSGPWKKSRSG
jgi:hypothetical protein